jgi:uncharacterized protein YkwD
MYDKHANASRRRFAMPGWSRARRVLAATTLALGVTTAATVPTASAHGGGCAFAHTPVGATSRAQLRTAVLCLINHQRTKRGLPRLRESRRLNRSAQGWTNDMVRHRDFSHGADFAARISAVGFNWQMVGENIAAGYATPASVVRAWMSSAGHCRNILTPEFTYVGTGVSAGSIPGAGGSGTWTQDFGLPMNRHAPSGNWGPADRCPY